MEKLSLPEIRPLQLHLLKKVTDFCERNHLNYSLGAGTLLGAVRHRGFIPWDDDIDIMMPRPDYEKLLAGFKAEDIRICHYKNTPGFRWPFAKFSDLQTQLFYRGEKVNALGVNIDVFPVDGCPDTPQKIKRHLRFLSRVIALRNYKDALRQNLPVKNKSIFFKFALRLGLWFLPMRLLLDKINTICRRYDFATAQKAGAITWGYGPCEVCPQSAFANQVEVEFEGLSLKAMQGYDIYLRQLYGDYMTLPPEEQQINGHPDEDFYWIKK